MSEFRRVLAGLVTAYGGHKQDLAKAIGITPQTFSKLQSGKKPTSPLICLKLAATTESAPSPILRAAGHGALADLIEDLYGAAAERRRPAGSVHVTPLEAAHLTALRSLRAPVRHAFLVLLEAAAAPRATRRSA